MGFFDYGKRVKPKRFDYIPQHYDPAVEDLKLRMAKYDNPEITDAELAKARIKSGFRINARGNKDALKKGNKSSNIRLLVVISGLILGTLYIMRSPEFQQMLEKFVQ